jgi:uncharacterized membrane protein
MSNRESTMSRKNYRPFVLMVVLCSAAGVVLGGTASWAESNQCLHAEVVTNKCLTQDPVSKTLEGMATGMLAGVGAAIGAAWHYRKES